MINLCLVHKTKYSVGSVCVVHTSDALVLSVPMYAAKILFLCNMNIHIIQTDVNKNSIWDHSKVALFMSYSF